MTKKAWAEMTDQEITANYVKQCSKCRYRGRIGGDQCCDYIVINGRSRGCSPIRCKKFEPGKRTKLIVGISQPGSKPANRRVLTGTGKKMAKARTYIGEILEGYMVEHDLNNHTMADLVGVKSSTMTEWRLGKSKVGEKSIIKISEATGISTEVIRDAVKKGIIEHGKL